MDLQTALFEAGHISRKQANISSEIINLKKSKRLADADVKLASDHRERKRHAHRRDVLIGKIEKLSFVLDKL